MIKSSEVEYVKPVISCNTEDILGIGYGVRINSLFTSLKLVKNQTCLFFFGIINVEEPHSESGCFIKTPSSTNRFTSLFSTLSEHVV